jgi:hypothetical protein
MVNFEARLTIAGLVSRLSVNSDSILIGRFFGAEPVDLFSRANVLLARPLASSHPDQRRLDSCTLATPV